MEDRGARLPIEICTKLADNKAADLKPVLELAPADPAARQKLVAGLQAQDEAYRYNCYKTLLPLAEQEPALLYPYWDTFTTMLGSENSYQRMVGVTFLSRLVRVDIERRFDGMREAYFAHLDDESVIVARYVAQNAGRIARGRPEWAGEITDRLLEIVRTYHNADRRDLLAADVIASCSEFLDLAPDRGRILAFVQGTAQSKSPKTRQAAREFLKKQPAASS